MFKFFGCNTEVKDFIASNKHFTKDNIYQNLTTEGIQDLAKDKQANAMTLVEIKGSLNSKWTHRTVYSSPRVGLTLKKYDPTKDQYLMRDYRFLTNPDMIKKCKSQIYLGMIGQGIKNASITSKVSL